MTNDTVSAYLSADHQHLDALADSAVALVRVGRLDDGVACFARFASRLDRHIDAEEQVLFPAFEELTGILAGPTAMLRGEHVDLRFRMDDVASAFAALDAGRCADALRVLDGLLRAHHRKEEQVLYPIADRALGSPSARALLVRDMKAL